MGAFSEALICNTRSDTHAEEVKRYDLFTELCLDQRMDPDAAASQAGLDRDNPHVQSILRRMKSILKTCRPA